jgi:peptidoglycan-synthase activator LpoB
MLKEISGVPRAATLRRSILGLVAAGCLLPGLAAAAPVASQGPVEPVVVAIPKIRSFAADSPAWAAFRQQGIDVRLTESLIQKLEQRGRLRPVATQALAGLLDAQDQAAIGRFRPQTEAKLRQTLGARYVLYASVAEYGLQGTGAAEIAQVGLVLNLVDIESSNPVVRFALRRESGPPAAGRTAAAPASAAATAGQGLSPREAELLRQASDAALDASIERLLKDLPR